MKGFDKERFVKLSVYWCGQRELSLSSKIPDVKAQALKQMKAVEKEQERMLEEVEQGLEVCETGKPLATQN